MGRILFIRGGAVGDFILTLPSIQLVRNHLPDAEIEILGYQPIIDLARSANLADATRSIEYGPLSSFFIPDTLLLPELMEYFAGFSVVISYLYDPDRFFETNLRKAGVESLLIGPHQVDETSGLPAASQLARPLEELALFLDAPFTELEFDDDARRRCTEFLQEQNLPADESKPSRLIALHPGSGSTRKNWSFEGWTEVLKKLASDPRTGEVRFVITSGEAEDRVIGEFLANMKKNGLSFIHAPHLPLPVAGSLLKQCDLYLGHDSGISHLAAACGQPSILLFGPTDPSIWAPQNPKVTSLLAPDGDLSKFDSKRVFEIAMENLLKT